MIKSRSERLLKLVRAVCIPFILLLSLPLAAFAAFTTAIAFWLLLLRVSFVYVELLSALLWSYLVPQPEPHIAGLPLPSPEKEQSPKSRRASRSSSSSSGLQMRAFEPSDSSVTLPAPLPVRDYEGVGGWQMPDDEDGVEAQWFDFHKRIDMPPTQPLWHTTRSSASLTKGQGGFTSPELIRTPLLYRTSGPTRGSASGTASPEDYFSTPKPLTSAGDRTSKVSFDDQGPGMLGSSPNSSSVKISRQDPA
ncbi:hypothetical protein LTR53_006628 [Teratosphaeriaceae sp. CCFEE 6253]|nr:hypothetical protein LTR53_006628 [Teratosphaeriaceae sp. CCFEE 6253]